MATREYAKAFKFLTQRLRDSTNDRSARLVITFVNNLCPHIVYWCNIHYRYFSDNHGNISYGNSHLIYKPLDDFHSDDFYSIGHLMRGFTKKDFIEMWIDNAIGSDLYVSDLYVNNGNVYRKTFKFLDKNDTVESLCVQYDMAHI